MRKTALVFASISGALAVLFGAIGSHVIGRAVEMNLIMPKLYDAYNTAVYFQLFHSIAIVAIIALQFKIPMYFNTIINLLMFGIALFSGSIYILVFGNYFNIPTSWIGPLTPVGGVCLIAAWFALYLSFRKLKEV